MSVIFETALKNEIKNTQRNVYIFVGNDGYLKKTYVKKISDAYTDEEDIFNFQKFTGECDLQDVYDSVLQFPVMSDKKVVILADYDFEKCSKTDYDKLCTIISETPDSCVFILYFDVLDVVTKKNNKFSKFVTLAEKNNGIAVELNHRTVPELVKMLTAGAQKRGCIFDGAAARYLVETAGDDINTLKNELEKLCFYIKKGEITKDTVDTVCIKTVEANVYNLSKHIVECNMNSALKLLDELFYLKVEPIVIISTISNFYVDMYRAFVGKERGMSVSEITEQFGYFGREFVVRNAINDSKKFSYKKFDLSFDALRAADKSLKSFSGDSRTALEQLAVRLGYIALKGEGLD